MEPWRRVCRAGWLPLLTEAQLAGLAGALARDDPAVCQQQTTEPLIYLAPDWPCAAACPVAYGEWLGRAHTPIEAVEAAFARRCREIDQGLHEVAGVRHLLRWIDETPRAEVVAGLLDEVRREQQQRAGA